MSSIEQLLLASRIQAAQLSSEVDQRHVSVAIDAIHCSGRPRRVSTIDLVPYDEELADRIRELMAGEEDVTEQRMFGGLAFLIRGNMAVAASGQGGVLVRVDPTNSERLLATAAAQPMEMGGRVMRGWLRVDDSGVRTKRQLASWVMRGTTYAGSLPAKQKP